MSETNKTAAAILACEASRQKLEKARSAGSLSSGYDISGSLLEYFDYFMVELDKRDAPKGMGG